ncbi:hypothetical protein MMC18_006591 [Xylographa bjoerkii]|nr:hypothetical protein [Xylographa bjoerkii]
MADPTNRKKAQDKKAASAESMSRQNSKNRRTKSIPTKSATEEDQAVQRHSAVIDNPGRAELPQRAKRDLGFRGVPGMMTTNIDQHPGRITANRTAPVACSLPHLETESLESSLSSDAYDERVPIDDLHAAGPDSPSLASDTKSPLGVGQSATTPGPTLGQEFESPAPQISLWNLIMASMNVIASAATVCADLMQKIWFFLKMVWRFKYLWLFLSCGLLWLWQTTDTLHLPKRQTIYTSWTPPYGIMESSMMDFARTLEKDSWLHPVPSLMRNAELDVVILSRQIGQAGIASAESSQRLCLEYVKVSRKVCDDLEELLLLNGTGGKRMVIILKSVIEVLEKIAMEQGQRPFIISVFFYAKRYHDSRVRISAVYNYLFPEAISVLEQILNPLGDLIKDIYTLVDIVRLIQTQIASAGIIAANEHTLLQNSFFHSLGFLSAKYKWSEKQLEMLRSITTLITVPEKRLTETRELLKKSRDSFVIMQSTLNISMPSEFTRTLTTSEVITELRIGSQAIEDALHRIEDEKRRYLSSEYYVDDDTGNAVVTLKHEK